MKPYEPVAIMLHDAPCLLCRASMRWVIDHDRESLFNFVPLDSDEGRELLFEHGFEPDQADSAVLIHDGRAWRHSDALVRTLRLLGGRWKAMGTMLRLVPRPLRDAGYRTVARHRHLWPFGGVCELPAQGASGSTSVVSTEPRSMRSVTPPSSRSTSGEASRSSSPAMESTTTTGRDDNE